MVSISLSVTDESSVYAGRCREAHQIEHHRRNPANATPVEGADRRLAASALSQRQHAVRAVEVDRKAIAGRNVDLGAVVVPADQLLIGRAVVVKHDIAELRDVPRRRRERHIVDDEFVGATGLRRRYLRRL